MKLVIVTGMSGAGKGTAVKIMEDMGYYCVDNLPIPLVEKFVDFTLQSEDELEKVAVSIDIRNSNALSELEGVLERIRQKGIRFEILFLEADDSVLVKRYKETRRSHPLAGGGRIDKGIGLERKKLAFLKEQADYIIDTSRLLQRELKAELERIFVRDEDYRNLYITVLSFGFKYGIRRIQTWYSMCVFCRIHIMWKDSVRRRETISRYRTLSCSTKRHMNFWTS